jgi:hypothetical protein
MLLPMFGFILTLLVVGGLAGVVAVGDPYHALVAPYIGFVIGSEWWSELGFFGGYAVGLCGGAALGFWRAFERRCRVEAAHE